MKKYEIYKDSGIEWIGEIPEHWEVKKLKHLTFIGNGRDHKDVWDENGKYPIMGTGGKFGNSNTFLYNKPSVLLGRKGTIDNPVYIDKPFWAVDTVYFTISKKDTNTKYLFYLTKTINFDLYKYGSAVPSMNQEVLKEIYFSIPTPEEQTAIAHYLDRKTAEIDELIADKKRLLELYEEEKTAIINQAVTKGINPNAPMKDSGIEWLGEIPEHWEVLPIKYTANVQTGRTPKIANSDIDFFENGYTNWYTPGDFNGNEILKESKRKIISEAFEKNQVELFPKQSIYLVSIGATLGKVSLSESEASANQQINIISFNKEKVVPHWGYYFIVGNKEMVLNEADYTTLPILNQTKLKNVWIAFPNLEEQKNIIAHVNDELDRLRLKVRNTKKLIDLLTEYRTALISEVVTGKIKVT